VDSLRLELNSKCFCLLSYHHLEFAKFESAQNEDVITLLFLNRTVRITGKNLRALGRGRCDIRFTPKTILTAFCEKHPSQFGRPMMV
jgi:hypothetical protein